MQCANHIPEPRDHKRRLRVGDTDTRTKNFAPDLSQIPDTISSITSAVITRTDGQTMTGSDLQVTAQPRVDTPRPHR